MKIFQKFVISGDCNWALWNWKMMKWGSYGSWSARMAWKGGLKGRHVHVSHFPWESDTWNRVKSCSKHGRIHQSTEGAWRSTLDNGGGGGGSAQWVTPVKTPGNDMVADLHFPRFFGTAIKCEIAWRLFPEKHSESRSTCSMQKYRNLKFFLLEFLHCLPKEVISFNKGNGEG